MRHAQRLLRLLEPTSNLSFTTRQIFGHNYLPASATLLEGWVKQLQQLMRALGPLLRLQLWLQRCAEQAQVCSFWLDWKISRSCRYIGLLETHRASCVFQMKGAGCHLAETFGEASETIGVGHCCSCGCRAAQSRLRCVEIVSVEEFSIRL
jgi:hypothetical protein